MRILGVASSETPCEYFRIRKPLEAIAAAGLATVELANRDPAGQYHFSSTRRGPNLYNVADYDLFVINRNHDSTVRSLANEGKQYGFKVVYDIDDDVFNVPPTNPAYAAWGRDGRKVAALQAAMLAKGTAKMKVTPEEMAAQARANFDSVVANIRAAHLVTVTTQTLADLYYPYNRAIAILPNQMYPQDWATVVAEPHPDELWIGWAGSGTHYDDLKLMASGAEAAVLALPHAKLVLTGFGNIGEFLFKDLQKVGKLVSHPWRSMEDYRSTLASFDIVLAPSDNNKFNAAKSDIRVLEAGMVGRPVVASECTYGYTVRASNGGLVAKDGQWQQAILKLAKDTELRQRLGDNLHRYAQTRTYARAAHDWYAVYARLVNEHNHADRVQSTHG